MKPESSLSVMPVRNALSSVRSALGNQLHAPIGEIADRAGHVVPAGDLPNRHAKPDALHPARIKYRHAFH